MAKKTKTTSDNGGFEASLFRAIRSARWLLPTSEQAVAEDDEALGDEPYALPEELSDPLGALEASRRTRTTRVVETPRRAEEVDASLARAAREGDENAAISEEIEKRMKRDKERARSESG